jgi:phage terminase large subunit-like protein
VGAPRSARVPPLARDRIVAEQNQGVLLVESVMRTVDPNLPIKLVHAGQGKLTRAEPVCALYEQGKV